MNILLTLNRNYLDVALVMLFSLKEIWHPLGISLTGEYAVFVQHTIRAYVDIAAIWSCICNRRELILVCYLIRYELA